MGGNSGITKEDFELFLNSGVPKTEETAENVVMGATYKTALDTPHGKILMKDVQDELVDELKKITSHKHNPAKSIAENYDNLLVAINKYQAVEAIKIKWVNILKKGEASLKRMEKVNNEIKKSEIR